MENLLSVVNDNVEVLSLIVSLLILFVGVIGLYRRERRE